MAETAAPGRSGDHGRPGLSAARPRIMSRPLALVFLASFGGLTSFFLLLSVVPLYATSAGAGGVAAGLVTGALMFGTVATELGTARLVARFGFRLTLAAGLLLLGAPALALAASGSLAAIVAVCLVRGAGLALVVVVGGALVAELVPAERRGEGLGLYGVVVGVPSVVALPTGVWLVGRVGYTPVFLAGALVALLGAAAVPGIRGGARSPERPVGLRAALARPGLRRPALVFASTTATAGVVAAFLPLAVTGASGNVAALGLLAQALAATGARWGAGRYGDRHGAGGPLLVPALVVAAAGMLGLAAPTGRAGVLVGMVLFGAGFGAAQNVTFTLMVARVTPGSYGTVSAVWNLAYDAGFGLGAAAFGVLAGAAGYPVGFAATAALLALALVPALRDRAGRHPTGAQEPDERKEPSWTP